VAAGDAFGGAFAVALGEGRGIETAVRAGTAAGALAVTRRGAQEAMPSREEVEKLMSGR
jgi:ribokinase